MADVSAEEIWKALPDPLRAQVLIEHLRQLVSAGREVWPDFQPDPAQASRCIAHKLDGAADPASAIRDLDAGEFWLAASVAGGDDTALAAFESRYMSAVLPALAHMDLQPTQLDDIRQQIRVRLLVPTNPDQPIRLIDYCGVGRLAALIKVIALRMGTDVLRQRHRRPDLQVNEHAGTVDALMETGLTAELEAIKHQHRTAFKAAFQSAVSALSTRDRMLLRMHLIERLSLDGIAALHQVHRATAARWLAKIRERLYDGMTERLATALQLSPEKLRVLYNTVRSQLDLSLSRVLSAEPGDNS